MKTAEESKKLYLDFSGRIIDQLGIQMYQSPVAAIAEIISNSWDADAEEVRVSLPESLSTDAVFVIKDNGNGMTFEDCQGRYLKAGYDTRGGNPIAKSPGKKRPLLGRKGIGKFAGFGIAKIITIKTVSGFTGEKTLFKLNIDKIRSDEYIGKRIELEDVQYFGPDEKRMAEHGTTIILSSLNLSRRPSLEGFARSMSRRFLLTQRVDNFSIFLNNNPIPESEVLENIEFVFPRDYHIDERPDGLALVAGVSGNDFGLEKLSNGREIKWKFVFYKDPIDEEELRGISVFTNKKLAQRPFLFNLVGGLHGQAGIEYLSGQVEADYLDGLQKDLISTERQRINWEDEESIPLLDWGQERIKKLLAIWKKRRMEEKEKIMMDKLSPFSRRIEKLLRSEQKIVTQALKKLASVSKIKTEEFSDIGNAVLTAWEGGRLKDLISELASVEDMSDEKLLEILLEAKVLTALHTAEAVKAKIDTIKGLEQRIKDRELENPLRDFIADSPWLISPEWETFKKELRVTKLLEEAASEARLDDLDDFKGRIDLALSSGGHLLIVEFMKPGVTIDLDHLGRFETYVQFVQMKIESQTASRFHKVTGIIVADGLARKQIVTRKLKNLAGEEMYAMDWHFLLNQAYSKWKDFLDILKERAPEDERLQSISLASNQVATAEHA